MIRNDGLMHSGLVIFDCDGVLIDSEPLSCVATSIELHEAGFPLSADVIAERFTGMSNASMLAAIEEEAGRPMPDDMAERLHEREMALLREDLEAVPQIADVLDHLDISGVAYCVASSSTPERLKVTLGHVGLYDRFPKVLSATMVKNGKPAPDLFLLAAREMAVPPDACIVIEDSVPGVCGARAAGMIALGFCGASHCRPGHGDDLMAAGAKMTFEAMRDLPDLLSTLLPRANVV